MKKLIAIALLIAGCQTKPMPQSQPAQQVQQQAARTVWRIAERPINDLNFMASCWGRNCLFRASGVWKSSTGKPGSELADPVSVSISCDKVQRQCTEIDASVNPIGFLDSSEMEFHVSSWSDDQIIATNVAGLCDIGRQLVIDLPGKTTILREYPTKQTTAENDPCAAFNDRNSFVLHGAKNLITCYRQQAVLRSNRSHFLTNRNVPSGTCVEMKIRDSTGIGVQERLL